MYQNALFHSYLKKFFYIKINRSCVAGWEFILVARFEKKQKSDVLGKEI